MKRLQVFYRYHRMVALLGLSAATILPSLGWSQSMSTTSSGSHKKALHQTTHTTRVSSAHKPHFTVYDTRTADEREASSLEKYSPSRLEQIMAARPVISPNTSGVSPVAFGMNWRTAFVGIAAHGGSHNSSKVFGNYAAGFGLGDADKYVSLTTVVAFGGLDDVTRDGNFNFQLTRDLSSQAAVAFGVENVAPWGGYKDNKMNTYGVATKVFPVFSETRWPMNVVGSLGVGNGRFVHNYTVPHPSDDVHTARPFANIGFQVLPKVVLIADYVGLTYNVGLSVVPFTKIPLVANVIAQDLTHRGGHRTPIAGTLGYFITF